MKISAYQANGQMLKEAQRVIRQQNLKELEQLNRQNQKQIRDQQLKAQWAKPNSVNVYA
jgi:mevalonate kinase